MVTVNNSVGSASALNFNAGAAALYVAIDAETRAYAVTLDGGSGTNAFYAVAGGFDAETNWDGPSATGGWVQGWINGYNINSDDMSYLTNGATFQYCSSASCWYANCASPGAVCDHGWNASQIYGINYAYGFEYAIPEMYDVGWGSYWQDLNQAAAAVGSSNAPRGPISFSGVTWSPGAGNEGSATQAWNDFQNET
ncbi:MAG: hypothetical protein ACRDJU_14640, partial [Actinomycetota bacterium]